MLLILASEPAEGLHAAGEISGSRVITIPGPESLES